MSADVLPTDVLTDRLGRPLRDLRLSLTDKCNFNCTYCMPKLRDRKYEFMRNSEIMTADEAVRVVRLFASQGVTKCRLTGGEPLLRPDIGEIVAGIGEIETIDDIAMTSNGFFLKDKLADLKAAGLTRVSISLDSVNASAFADISGREEGDLSRVLEGINEAIALGMNPVKINMVVMKGVNAEQILEMVDFFKDTDCSLRFIEYMDTGTVNKWSVDEVMSAADIVNEVKTRYAISAATDSQYGEVATRYKMDDYPLRLGFITSVSRPFCSDCVRARVSADGKFFSCLFGASSFDMLELMRGGAGDDEIVGVLKEKWEARDDRYSELRRERRETAQKEEMFKLGG